MASSTKPPTPSMVTNAPPLASMEAKMTAATGHARCQQLKDMLSKEDSPINQTSTLIPRSPPSFMDPGLLAVASSGSWKELQSFLNGDPRPTSSAETIVSSAIKQPPLDQEALARVSFLDEVTGEGDTFLHVMATNGVGEDLVEVGLIHARAVRLLSVQNNNGDTPLHCAARAAEVRTLSFLIRLASDNNPNTVKDLLETENKSRWTVLHEAVRVGNPEIVSLLMNADPHLASVPKDGTSPMYLAVSLRNGTIAQRLYNKSNGILSYSGPNGQNALHAAVLRGRTLTDMLLRWNDALATQQDENGSTPLHFAACMVHIVEKVVRGFKHLPLLNANPDALYQPDYDGYFPIHVAASVGALSSLVGFLRKSPNCAGLRDARGRTFLHVAVENKQKSIVDRACRFYRLSWILNMQDNDGNTALHLAVQAGALTVFCPLFGNGYVDMDLPNKKGKTPLDIARCNLPKEGFYYYQSSEAKIHLALKFAAAACGIFRPDYSSSRKKDNLQASHDMDMVKDSTQNLYICSVLIATLTFGATFAMPGGYRADGHTNGGTPTLAGRYVFDAFIIANGLAFAFSMMAVISLMSSGSPIHNLRSRVIHMCMAFYFMDISVTSLVAAFAIGTYMMLAPVAQKSAIAVCVLSSLVLLYANLEMVLKNSMLIPAFCRRMSIPDGIALKLPMMLLSFMGISILQLWPIVVIFAWTAFNYMGRNVEPAVQPPTPLA